jgi:hypothetical protein
MLRAKKPACHSHQYVVLFRHTGGTVVRVNQRNLLPEFDYLALLQLLSDYQSPRDKITRMLKEGEIIRVKKGLYVWGNESGAAPYSKEVLANQIYGPSYISLEYALSYYGMIPERVEVVTSMTCRRNKEFTTPVGGFSYRYLSLSKYPVGITQISIDPNRAILIATREKALADKLLFSDQGQINSFRDLESFLCEDLRIDQGEIAKLNRNRLKEIGLAYQMVSLDLLYQHLVGGSK